MIRTLGDLICDDLDAWRPWDINMCMGGAPPKHDDLAKFQKCCEEPVEVHWDRQKDPKARERHVLSDQNPWGFDL